VEEEANKKFFEDIAELANDCVTAMRTYRRRKDKKDEERKNRGSSYEDELAEEAKKAAEFVIRGKSATDSKEDLFNAPLPIKGIRKTIELSQDAEIDDGSEEPTFDQDGQISSPSRGSLILDKPSRGRGGLSLNDIPEEAKDSTVDSNLIPKGTG
jgi:hypothetical protein